MLCPSLWSAAYHILIIGIQRRDEECRLHVVARQHVQQVRRVGAGAVVKGEIDGLRVAGLDAVGLAAREQRLCAAPPS